ncbi:MAG: tannase/feruloyl esterase family alpha/beta hydrolase [Novosphingobium sp.]
MRGSSNREIRTRLRRGSRSAPLAAVALTLPCTALAASTDDDANCNALGNGQRIGNAVIVSAAHVADGSARDPNGASFKDLGGYCRVVAVASTEPRSNILIEVWLPDRARWNGKFLGTGNGGFAGSISVGALAGGLRRGFAVANTDMGTFPAGQQGGSGQIGYAAGNGRRAAVRDWGYRATHEMTLLAKAVIARFYGAKAKSSLFAGCSTGGHQALTEAQRFPDDYDGIIAGAPGHNRTHLHTMFLMQAMVMNRPGFVLPSLKSLTLWTDHWRAKCVGKDGGAPGDLFLTDPSLCKASPRELVCKAGDTSASCIPERELAQLETIYAATRNPRTGAVIYPRINIGAEQSMVRYASLMAGFKPRGVPAEIARWAFPPTWNPATFDFDRDVDRVDQALAADINANNPNLTRFAARGGKLIMWHGWEDYLVSPYDSIIYYDRAFASGTDKGDFLRLFLAPGVDHCGAGAGPDSFGQMASIESFQRNGGPASHDMLSALEAWVDAGKAPDSIMAAKYSATNPDKPVAQRPLCPYPLAARYVGTGSASEATSFSCQVAPTPVFERPSDIYLK